MTISGAIAGQVYILGVKYQVSSLKGVPAPSPTTVNYTFVTSLNGTPVPTSRQGIPLVKQ